MRRYFEYPFDDTVRTKLLGYYSELDSSNTSMRGGDHHTCRKC
jgi:hypothetical protein